MKEYVIDMERAMEYVSTLKKSEQFNNTVITENWGYIDNGEEIQTEEFRVINKEVTESKSKNNADASQLRYDFLKSLIAMVITPVADDSGQIQKVQDPEDMHFGQKLCFNTLLHENIIIETDKDE